MSSPMIRENIPDEIIELSPSRIQRFRSCIGFFLYSAIFPQMRFTKNDISATGRLFHNMAQVNFDKAYVKVLIKEESDKVRNQITTSIGIVESRDYFQYEHENEVYLEYTIAKKGRLRGYIDRIVHFPDGKIGIVDYKTSSMPDVAKDKDQLMSYAYMLVKLRKIDPNNIVLILDYVVKDEIYRFNLRDIDITIHHNTLLSTILEMKEVVDEWNKKKDIRSIEHTPGDCIFCPMNGLCVAYRLLINPVFDGIEESDIMTNADIAKELAEREYAVKINKARADALKRTLMARYKDGDKTVTTLVSVISPERVSYRSSEVISKLIPDMVDGALRNERFAEIVNKDSIAGKLTKLMSASLPEYMDRSSLDPELVTKLGDYGKYINISPYIKSKRTK